MEALVPQAAIPPADIVGNAFVHQYYLILRQSPGLVHRFYQDGSKLGRPGEDGNMSTTTTMQAINEKILSLGYGELKSEISSVDSQESYNGGVLVLVTGYLIGNDNVRLKFTQSFFLAPQEKGYFVLNDVFQYVDGPKPQNGNRDLVDNIKVHVAPDQGPSALKNHISEPTSQSEEINGGEVHNPSENGDLVGKEEEEKPVPEVVDEVRDVSDMVADAQMVSESSSKVEELPKKSYASIVKVLKEHDVPFSSSTSSPIRSAPKIQEQVPTAVPPAQTTEMVGATSNASEDGNTQETEVTAEGPSIYLKGLPLDATPVLLENEFKKFGPIRAGGIQVRFQKGFCFGFVEFEVASAVQSALEASPIMINGFRVIVEEKRSTRGNRGRFSSGAGAGYRNEGARSRGNFGGKMYGRGDFVGRTDYGNRGGNRGGFPNRGGDGYRKTDKMGGNGGRANRGGGLNFNAATKNTAPRVSATA